MGRRLWRGIEGKVRIEGIEQAELSATSWISVVLLGREDLVERARKRLASWKEGIELEPALRRRVKARAMGVKELCTASRDAHKTA